MGAMSLEQARLYTRAAPPLWKQRKPRRARAEDTRRDVLLGNTARQDMTQQAEIRAYLART